VTQKQDSPLEFVRRFADTLSSSNTRLGPRRSNDPLAVCDALHELQRALCAHAFLIDRCDDVSDVSFVLGHHATT
jgi:hypothetical protein